jgi:hypothetical protein
LKPAGLKTLVYASYSESIMQMLFRRLFAGLIALSLIGVTMMQLAVPAFAVTGSASSASADSDPCDQMAMGQPEQGQAVPCNSMPCKGTLSDCIQMCLAFYAPLALPTPSVVAIAIPSTFALQYWPAQVIAAGLSIKPEPFPPKLPIAA